MSQNAEPQKRQNDSGRFATCSVLTDVPCFPQNGELADLDGLAEQICQELGAQKRDVIEALAYFRQRKMNFDKCLHQNSGSVSTLLGILVVCTCLEIKGSQERQVFVCLFVRRIEHLSYYDYLTFCLSSRA